jgi:hypothetical protein
VFVIDTVNG